MPNSERLDDAAFPRSPMIERIERNQRNFSARQIVGITALIAGAALTVDMVGPQILKLFGQNNVAVGVGDADASSGPCAPGNLDCLDDRFYEENGFPFSPGSPDGCVLLCKDEQLKSPLCCPHVAADPSACPQPENAADDAGPDSSRP